MSFLGGIKTDLQFHEKSKKSLNQLASLQFI
jgi:hypothetical protein